MILKRLFDKKIIITHHFKNVHDYGRIIEDLDRADNHKSISYPHEYLLASDNALQSIPYIIKEKRSKNKKKSASNKGLLT
jgi:hypothetical protein